MVCNEMTYGNTQFQNADELSIASMGSLSVGDLVLPDEIYDMVVDFETWSKNVLKTGQQKMDAIVEACRRYNIDNDTIRKLFDMIWKSLGYSVSHGRKLLAANYPELVHIEF